MVEQNVPQAQAGGLGIQQPPYGFGGGQSGYQPIGGQPYQTFQQPLTQELAMQQNPGQQQQNPGWQNSGQQSIGQQSPIQQNPAQQSPNQQQQTPGWQNQGQQGIGQQNPMQQNPAQQNQAQQPPQRVGQQSQSGGMQQRTEQPQTRATQSWYQSTLAGTPSSLGSAQQTGQGASSQFGPSSAGQPYQSQQQGTGQPQFAPSTSAGPYGGQSAMMQSPTMATAQGPSIQSPVSEFSASDTAGTQFQTASGPQRQATESHQAPTGGSGYEQAVGQELRAAVGGLDQLANVAEWAETRFAQQGNADASRACEDVHDRAHMAADFILRGSPFAASAARELQATIGGAMQELQRHSTPEAQEVLTRAQQANQLLEEAILRLSPAGSASVQ